MSARLLFAFLALLAPRARAEPGTTAAPILTRSFSARAAALGEAWAAGTGLEAVEYNPAGLGALGRGLALLGYQKGFDDGDYGLLAAGRDLGGGSGALAVGVLYHNAGSVGLNLSDGTQRTVTAGEDTSPFLSGSYALGGGLSVGLTARYLRSVLAEQYSASTYCGDAGVRWQGPWGLALGASLQNVGKDVAFDQVGDPLPRTVRAGAQLRLKDVDATKLGGTADLEGLDLLLAADYVQVRGEDGAPRVGFELGLKTFGLPPIMFRGGYIFNRDEQGLTLGFGYDGARLGIDYAAQPTKDLGVTHLLTLKVKL